MNNIELNNFVNIDLDFNKCYICHESDGDLYNICNCKSLWIHIECQKKMMSLIPIHNTNCPICKTKYNNIILEYYYKIHWINILFISIFLIGSFLCFIISIYLLYLYFNKNDRHAIYIFIFTLLVSQFTLFFIIYLHKKFKLNLYTKILNKCIIIENK